MAFDSARSISKTVLSKSGCDNTLICSFTFEKQMAKICTNNSHVCLQFAVIINHFPVKCRLRFVLFVMIMLSMTIALNLAIDINEDPTVYRAIAKDILRGSMEAITLICILYYTISEISNIYTYVTLKILLFVHFSPWILCVYRWRLSYFKQHALFGFNYVHVVTCFAVYCIIPLRLFNFTLEWIFASLAYVSHGLIIFKYMMAVRYIFYDSYGEIFREKEIIERVREMVRVRQISERDRERGA